MAVTKQLYGTTIDNYLGASRIVVVYKIAGLSTGDDDAWQLELNPKGFNHPLSTGTNALYPGAILRGYRLIRRINPTTVLGAEVYSSNLAFSGGPRDASAASGKTALQEVPIFQNVNGKWILSQLVELDRAVFERVETRYMNGNQVSAVMEAIAANLGRYYYFGAPPVGVGLGSDRWYKLNGNSRVAFDGTSRTVAQYAFEILCAFPPIPIGSVFGNDRAIPEVPEQHKLTWYFDVDGFPIIQAVPQDQFALTGGPLPDFP